MIRVFALASLVLLLSPVGSHAQTDTGDSVSVGETAWSELKQILSMSVSFEAHDEPLEQVVHELSAQAGVRVLIENAALDDLGIGTDEPVSIRMKGVQLRSLLEAMLGPLELTWSYRYESLVITTEEEEESRLVVRAYPVGDLVRRLARGRGYGDYDTIIDTIISTVASESWAENGGGESEVRPFPPAQALVVSQSVQVHLRIESLLDELRRVGRSQGLDLWAPAGPVGAPRGGVRERTYLRATGRWLAPRVYGKQASSSEPD